MGLKHSITCAIQFDYTKMKAQRYLLFKLTNINKSKLDNYSPQIEVPLFPPFSTQAFQNVLFYFKSVIVLVNLLFNSFRIIVDISDSIICIPFPVVRYFRHDYVYSLPRSRGGYTWLKNTHMFI